MKNATDTQTNGSTFKYLLLTIFLISLFVSSYDCAKSAPPPEAILLTPQSRKVDNMMNLNTPPCGGAVKGRTHFMATPGSRNYIGWKVIEPSETGNCSIRFGSGLDEKEFKTLHPLDGTADKKGSFPCGREATPLEGKEVKLPRDAVECDSCVIQWEWRTEKGQAHYCADVSVIAGSGEFAEDCSGRC